MFRGIIFDNLEEWNIRTKKCNTEVEAKQEVSESIKRLCKKFKIETTDNRFILDYIEAE